jgi:hypothetical protein
VDAVKFILILCDSDLLLLDLLECFEGGWEIPAAVMGYYFWLQA